MQGRRPPLQLLPPHPEKGVDARSVRSRGTYYGAQHLNSVTVTIPISTTAMRPYGKPAVHKLLSARLHQNDTPWSP